MKNVIPLPASPVNSVDRELMQHVDAIQHLFRKQVLLTLHAIQQAESDCLKRLSEYVPVDRPLTVEEAATYLGMTKRALNDGTRPGKNPVVPFLFINGKKLFRKCSLDRELEIREIKKPEVRL